MADQVTDHPKDQDIDHHLRAAWDATPESAAELPGRLEPLSEALMQLALHPDEAVWRRYFAAPLLASMEDAFLKQIIPRVAERLGTGWAEDSLSFVDVSIGSARLHETVRRLATRVARRAATPVIPVLVPPWEQHVLAATLAAHRVCDAGQRAVMLTGLTPDQAARMPIVQTAPAILISATDRPARQRLENFVKSLRRSLTNPIPIIAGGPGFDRPYMDTCRTAIPMCATNDPVAALRACGVELGMPAPAGGPGGTSPVSPIAEDR